MRYLYSIAVIFCVGCGDGLQYQADKYVSYESMDEMVSQIVECIKNEDATSLLKILDNDALIIDLLKQSKGQDALRTKAYLNSKQGQRNYSLDQMNKKERIRIFLNKGIQQQLSLNPSAFKSTGFEFQSDADYASGVAAKIQKYQIRLENGDDQQYAYDIKVIYCKGKYHLIEAAGFLEVQS